MAAFAPDEPAGLDGEPGFVIAARSLPQTPGTVITGASGATFAVVTEAPVLSPGLGLAAGTCARADECPKASDMNNVKISHQQRIGNVASARELEMLTQGTGEWALAVAERCISSGKAGQVIHDPAGATAQRDQIKQAGRQLQRPARE